MSKLCQCPRCGERSFEKLTTYSHCFNCLYSEDSWEGPEAAYFKAMQDIAEIEKSKQQKEKNEPQRERKNEIQKCA